MQIHIIEEFLKVLKKIIANNLRNSFREVFIDINPASNRFYPDREKWWALIPSGSAGY
ncbi:MAG: hypothetical protein ACETWM_14700 [Candidatus Lokiarchaeia archaeon]